jgi:hypothetical protein
MRIFPQIFVAFLENFNFINYLMYPTTQKVQFYVHTFHLEFEANEVRNYVENANF